MKIACVQTPPPFPQEKSEKGALCPIFPEERGGLYTDQNEDYPMSMYRPVSEVASETASVLCRIALWECFWGKNRNRTIAWWRNFATTTRILEIVVFFCKLGILLFKTSSWLTNLNKKAKTKWILVIVVKCRHHEIWTIANYKMIMPPKNPTDQFETTPTQ